MYTSTNSAIAPPARTTLETFTTIKPGITAPIPAAANARTTRKTNHCVGDGLGMAIAIVNISATKTTPHANAVTFSQFASMNPGLGAGRAGIFLKPCSIYDRETRSTSDASPSTVNVKSPILPDPVQFGHGRSPITPLPRQYLQCPSGALFSF
jgi:hypothetical protein